MSFNIYSQTLGWTIGDKLSNGNFIITNNDDILNSWTATLNSDGTYTYTNDLDALQSFSETINFDGSITTSNDLDVLESFTTRYNSFMDTYTISDDLNPLNSSTGTRNYDGSVTITDDLNPLNSSTARRNYDGSVTITDDFPKINSNISSNQTKESVNIESVNYDGLLESNQLLVDAQSDYNNAVSEGIEQSFQSVTSVLDVYIAEAAIKSREQLASFPVVNEMSKYDFNKFKYIVLYNTPGAHRDVKRNFLKKIKGKNYPIYVNTEKPFKTHDEYPEDLKNNPELGIYLSSWANAPYMVNGYFQLYNYKGELLYSSAGEGWSFSSIAKSFLAYLEELKK